MQLQGHVLSGRYVLEEPIGSGGAGVVWRATDSMLERPVAVKMLGIGVSEDPDAVARFRLEATAAASLTHPHAVVVFDTGCDDERDYLVMEFVDGSTLERLLRTGTLPAGVVAALGAQLASALGAAHAGGLVHRDVKPSNVLVTTDGIPKLSDFGIARALGETTSRVTTPGSLMGTARYIAPEQLRNQDVDGRADVYSLGLLLHQALTGSAPFGQGTAVEVAMRRLSVDVPRVSESHPEVPPELDDVIAKATQRDPGDRFGDADEFAAALTPLAAPDASRLLAARHASGPARSDASTVAPAVAPLVLPDHTPVLAPQALTVGAEGPDGTRRLATDPATNTTRVLGTDVTQRHVVTSPNTTRVDADPSVDVHPAQDVHPPGDAGHQKLPRRRALWIALAALVLIGALALMTGDDRGRDAFGSGADAASDSIRVVAGGDHDPFGSGEEHSAHVPSAYDGDTSTFWRTSRYRGSPQLGGLKPGVGIWLDLDESREVAAMVIHTTNPGASMRVFVGDAPPAAGVAPEDWGDEVARIDRAVDAHRVEFDEVVEGRVWLLWFTELPPDGGQYRATVADVEFLGS